MTPLDRNTPSVLMHSVLTRIDLRERDQSNWTKKGRSLKGCHMLSLALRARLMQTSDSKCRLHPAGQDATLNTMI